MAYCTVLGFVAFNNADLVPNGFIFPILSRERTAGSVSQSKLKNPPKGVSFKETEEGTIIETRRQLPAQSISLDLVFRKSHPSIAEALGETPLGQEMGSIGGILGFGAGGAIINAILTSFIVGGLDAGNTDFALQFIDAKTRFNVPITLTAEQIKSRQIELSNYPVSVFSVTKEKIDFTDEEKKIIGEASPYRGIGGITRANGSFNHCRATLQLFCDDPAVLNATSASFDFSGSVRRLESAANTFRRTAGEPSNFVAGQNISSQSLDPEDNLFIRIVKDERKFAFRADNNEASSRKDTPFAHKPDQSNDLTDKIIEIDTSGLSEGDTVYMTANLAANRRIRHLIRHSGTVVQTSSPAGIAASDVFGINFKIDAWNFKIAKWRVDKDFLAALGGHDVAFDFTTSVNALADAANVFAASAGAASDFEAGSSTSDKNFDLIEGWRLSETISLSTQEMWAADSRGIVKVNLKNNTSEIVFAKDRIRDQEWFNQFLEDNSLQNSFIEDILTDIDKTGVLFDLNIETNSLLFDNQKIPYHRPFALALKKMSRFNPDDTVSGIGFPLLDLSSAGHDLVDDLDLYVFDADRDDEAIEFDLSNIVIEETPMTSIFPSAYGGFTCGGIDPTEDLNNGAFFNPRDPNFRFSVFIPIPQPEVESDWVISTPQFLDNFTTSSRVYVEDHMGQRIDPFTLRRSSIYARTKPAASYLTAEVNQVTQSGYVVLNSNPTSSISYHKFEERHMGGSLKSLEVDSSRTHDRPNFDEDFFEIVGFNRLIGDIPSYSDARVVSGHDGSIATGQETQESLFDEIELSIGFISSLPHSVNVDDSKAIQKITLEFTYIPNKIKEIAFHERDVAIEFQGSETIIDSINIPFEFTEGDLSKKGKAIIDCAFYRGGPLLLHGKLWQKLTITKATATVIDLNVLGEHSIDATDMSISFDGKDRVCIFYVDPDSDNLSVFLSSDGSKSWQNYRDIIRLTVGESISRPFAYKNPFDQFVRLFFVLNEQFLMFRNFNTNLLVTEDINATYKPPDVFDENSDDDLGLENFSDQGKKLRKRESWFVCGDKKDEYLKAHTASSESREKLCKSFRFIADPASDLDRPFSDAQYSLFTDRKQSIKIFISIDGKLTVKGTSDFKVWVNLVKDINFHKNFKSEDSADISNIQVIYDRGSDRLFAVYYHDGMMFFRRLQGILVELKRSEDLAQASTNLTNYLTSMENDETRPIFLAGDLNEAIKDAIANKNADLAVKFNYPASSASSVAKNQFAEKFTSGNLSIDTSVQSIGYFTKGGLCRVFYQSDNGLLQGLTVNLDLPTPEDDSTSKEQDEQDKPGNAFNPKLDVHLKSSL